MAKNRIYQSFRWDSSIQSITLGKQTSDFVVALEEVISGCNKAVDVFNANPANLESRNGKKMDYVEYDEVYEWLDNGQNINVSIYTFGIIDVTSDMTDYQDKIILIKDCELDDNDIKAIQLPFESEAFFRGYMKRVCDVFGGCYRLISFNEFDLNYQALKEEYQYIVHTKINFN